MTSKTYLSIISAAKFSSPDAFSRAVEAYGKLVLDEYSDNLLDKLASRFDDSLNLEGIREILDIVSNTKDNKIKNIEI